MFNANNPPSPQSDKEAYRKNREEELRKHILDTYIKTDEYYQEGEDAKKVSNQMLGHGVYFNGELIGYNPNQKAPEALMKLSEEIQEQVTEYDNAKAVNRLKHLRTVLVNGQYESMVEDLKRHFPGVSFRTAEQMDDSVFDKKSEVFKSFEDIINEQLDKELQGK